jgi:hypothetical protein
MFFHKKIKFTKAEALDVVSEIFEGCFDCCASLSNHVNEQASHADVHVSKSMLYF